MYRQVLQAKPNYPDALHLLGMIAFQAGRNETAVELINKAIGADPSNPSYYHDLGAVFQRQGRLAEAVACYHNALAIKPDFVDAEFDLGNALSALGKLDEAVSSYRKVLSFNADDAQACNNLAVVLQRQGKLDEAVASYRRALVLDPDSPNLHYNLGNALKDQGKLDDAVVSYNKAIALDPASLKAHLNLAIVLQIQGKSSETIAQYRRLLAIKPDYAEGHYNLGRTFQVEGRLDEAVACYRRALLFKPGYADAHNELGNALVARGKLADAIACYRNAISLQPGFAEAHNNLGNALHQLGRFDDAVKSYQRALELRETPEIKMSLARCLQDIDFRRVDAKLRQLVTRAVSEPWARPADLARTSIKIIRSDPVISESIERASRAWPARPDRKAILQSTELEVLSGDLLLRSLLESTPACDLALERFLTVVRHAVLDTVTDADNDVAPGDKVLGFYCALARQCFINEFVFAYTDEEFERVCALRQRLVAAMQLQTAFPAMWVVAVGAYVPLFSLPAAETLLQHAWPEPVVALLAQEVTEPRQERQLRDSIPTISTVEDDVSRRVQQQYEENPYPRWIKSNPRHQALPINEYLRQLFHAAPLQPLDQAGDIDILVAGCGTGQEPIETAQQVLGAKVLAVDLSLSSLSYAKRKTLEIGVENVEYARGDIMSLRSIGRTFHVVQSFGVLHHLADPKAGLRELVSLVRPGGLMFLGLYSERARETIVAARSYIAERGYTADSPDIRRCRQDLMSPEHGTRFGQLTAFSDFYSISECRDLLFHVQEHRFTLPQIKELLGSLDLRFIGFLLKPPVINEYRKRFPDDEARTNLDHWNDFEAEFPGTFMGTYGFWVQRPGSSR